MKYTLHIAFDGKFGDIILRVDERVKQFGQAEAPAYKPLLFTPNGNGFDVKRPEKSCKTAEAIAYMIDWRAGLALEWLGKNSEEKLKDGDAITDFIEKEYIRNVTVDSPFDPELHIMLYVPLYKSEAVGYAERLIKNLPASYKIVVNVIALPYDVAEATEMLDTKIDRIERNKIMRKSMKDLLKLRDTYESFRYILFFQNRNIDGWSINYNREKLICTLSDIAVNLIANYHDVAKYVEDNKPVLVINSQSYVLDIYYAFNKWIGDLFKGEAEDHLLDNENEEEAEQEAERIYKDIVQKENLVIKDFVGGLNLSEREYNYGELEEEFKSKCAQKIQLIIEEECADKPVTVRHQLYKKFHNVGGLDVDAVEDAIDEALEQDRLFIENLVVDDEIKAAYNRLADCLNEIKKLKIQIEKDEAEVELLKDQLSDADYQYVELTDEGLRFGKNIFKPNRAKDRPLANTYTPAANETLPSSVDLRPLFATIKNQGHQGACTAFSLVAVFEYFLKRISGEDIDLSEAFSYFNSRKQAGNTEIDEGANFYDVLQAATDCGLCLEHLCPYDEDVYTEKPSDESYQDGQNRLVTEAKNVQINIDDIKSALASGLPVVVSVKSFGAMKKIANGFVCYDILDDDKPTDAYHAMVICGYSDKEGYFIVRNSWGKDFGDRGYCYFPYAAFRGGDAISSCYVITGISNSVLDELANNDNKPFSLDGDTATAKYEIIRNKIIEKNHVLGENRKRLFETRSEYSKLCKQLGEKDVAEESVAEIDKQIAELRSKTSGNDSKFRLFGRKSEDGSEVRELLFKRNTMYLNTIVITGLRKLNKEYLDEAGVIEDTSELLAHENEKIDNLRKQDDVSYFRTLSPKKFDFTSFLNAALSQEGIQSLLTNAKNAISDVYHNKIGLYEVFGALSQGLHDYVLKNLGVTILDYLDDERGIQFFNSINHSSVMAMIEGWVPQGAGNDVIHLTMPTDNPQIDVKLSESINMLVSTDKYRITFLHVERYSADEIALFGIVKRFALKAKSLARKEENGKEEKMTLKAWMATPAKHVLFAEAEPLLTSDEMIDLENEIDKMIEQEEKQNKNPLT